MTKLIALSQNKSAIVDDEDYEWLIQWSWHADFDGYNWYAKRNDRSSGKHLNVKMHREIAGVRSKDVLVDHHNHNGLDNRKENLRVCTHSGNSRNTKAHKDNKTGYKGVVRIGNRYRAYIHVNGRQKHLGVHETPELAARAYDEAAKNYFGEYAHLNMADFQID